MKSKLIYFLSFFGFFAYSAIYAQSSSRALAEELGSTDDSVVAMEVNDKNKQVVYFARSLVAGEKEKLEQLVPNLKVIVGLSRAEALARAGEAHGVDIQFASPEFLAKAENLKWVQATSAGVDRILSNEALMQNDDLVLTNCRAVHGPSIADHAMALLLYQTRNLAVYANAQKEGKWNKSAAHKPAVTLKGRTMLVIGVGGIGSEIAERAHGFGMNVIGIRKSDKPSPAFIKKMGKPKDLMTMLPEADVVAIATPLTPETQGMMSKEAFAVMKEGAYLINIARGKIVDTEAMIEVLESGKLAGACIDVTDPEPLPQGHSLWTTKNVIITPHISGRSAMTDERRSALRVENWRRFASGEPLLNVVNKEAGY